MVWKSTKFIRKAFTLIELLVVVAIIALLISILLPSLNRAKKQARQVICLTNVRSQGEAAMLYAEDNEGFLPRAMLGIHDGRFYPGYHDYATAQLPYLGWSGEKALQIRAQSVVDVSADAGKLWRPNSPFGNDWWRVLNAVLRKVPQFQCPDYPETEDLVDGQDEKGNPLDYVSSAMPIPYSAKNLALDSSGVTWDPDGVATGVPTDLSDYMEVSKIERFPPGTSPAALIFTTEAHTTLPWNVGGDQRGPLFHHFFLTQHLPFGGFPRIADDQRHPGGLVALFFDGHAEPMDLHKMDAAYPNPLDQRLKWFTVMPDFYFPGGSP